MVPNNREAKIKVKIEKIVNRGFGLGYSDGKPVFVYSGIPGDLVNVKIIHQNKKAIFAKIINIIEPSEFRIDSACDSDKDCGGCDWLSIDYRQQLKFKENILKEIHHGLTIQSLLDPCSSPALNSYRNKSFMPLGMRNGEPVIGMFAHRSHSIVTHSVCKLHNPVFDAIAEDFISYIKSSNETIYNEKITKGNIRHLGFRISKDESEIIVIVVTKKRKLAFTKQLVNLLTGKFPSISGIIQNVNPRNTNVILGNDDKILYGNPYIESALEDIHYRIHYRSFFQVNYGIAKLLYKKIRQSLNPKDKVIDAYCGIGSIGLFVARNVNHVWGIEENSNAIIDAEHNKQINNLSNIDFVEGRVEDRIDDLVRTSGANTIILDPPRKGLDSGIIDVIISSGISKIIYVSCDPTTQKRDVQMLVKSGFNIIESQLFDMFPQTYHMENLMILERK